MATLKERLRADLTDALRSRDEIALATLRMALAAVTRAEVAGAEQVVLSDDQVVGVLRSELAKRTEAAEFYAGAGRQELAARERAEAEILTRYLPAQVDDAALAGVVAEEVERAAADGMTGPKAMGPIIKAVRERVGQGAAGGRIADAVKRALAAGS